MSIKTNGLYRLTHGQQPDAMLCNTHMTDVALGDVVWTVAAVSGVDPNVYTLQMTAPMEGNPVLRLDRYGNGSTDETLPGLDVPTEEAHYNSQDWVLKSGDPNWSITHKLTGRTLTVDPENLHTVWAEENADVDQNWVFTIETKRA